MKCAVLFDEVIFPAWQSLFQLHKVVVVYLVYFNVYLLWQPGSRKASFVDVPYKCVYFDMHCSDNIIISLKCLKFLLTIVKVCFG